MKWIFCWPHYVVVLEKNSTKLFFHFANIFQEKTGLDCPRSCKNYYSWSNSNMTSHGVMLTIESHGGQWDLQRHLGSSPWKAIKLMTTFSKKENQARRPNSSFNLQNTPCDVTTFKRSGARFAAFSQLSMRCFWKFFLYIRTKVRWFDKPEPKHNINNI